MRDALEKLDPDILEVFAELRRLDAAFDRELGLPQSEELAPIEPLLLDSLDNPDVLRERSAQDHLKRLDQLKREFADNLRNYEARLVRMRVGLDRSRGSKAVDSAGERVYAASVEQLEEWQANPPFSFDADQMIRAAAVSRGLHEAFEQLWLARLDHLHETCAPDMRPKVDKAIAWQRESMEESRRLSEESDRALDALKKLKED